MTTSFLDLVWLSAVALTLLALGYMVGFVDAVTSITGS